MALRAGATLDAGGGTSTVRGWLMMFWDWEDVTGLYELVWCITTLVRKASSVRKKRLTISLVEEVEKYVTVLDEVLS